MTPFADMMIAGQSYKYDYNDYSKFKYKYDNDTNAITVLSKHKYLPAASHSFS